MLAAAHTAGLPPVEDGTLEQEPGSGVRGIVGGIAVSVGTLDWVCRYTTRPGTSAAGTGADDPAVLGTETSLQPDASQAFQRQHQQVSRLTRVYVGVGDSVAAYIDVIDDLRLGAAATIAGLRRMGITPILLSGRCQVLHRPVFDGNARPDAQSSLDTCCLQGISRGQRKPSQLQWALTLSTCMRASSPQGRLP